MSNSYKKLCNLLAASNINEKEIYDFISTLQNANPHEVLDYISEVRKLLNTELNHYNYAYNSKNWYNPDNFEMPSETEKKIVHLLLEEADLPKTVAIALMTQELEKRLHFQVPSESRKGFSNWIRKLLSIIPESELLHIATLIRNNFVHEQSYDWKLK